MFWLCVLTGYCRNQRVGSRRTNPASFDRSPEQESWRLVTVRTVISLWLKLLWQTPPPHSVWTPLHSLPRVQVQSPQAENRRTLPARRSPKVLTHLDQHWRVWQQVWSPPARNTGKPKIMILTMDILILWNYYGGLMNEFLTTLLHTENSCIS